MGYQWHHHTTTPIGRPPLLFIDLLSVNTTAIFHPDTDASQPASQPGNSLCTCVCKSNKTAGVLKLNFGFICLTNPYANSNPNQKLSSWAEGYAPRTPIAPRPFCFILFSFTALMALPLPLPLPCFLTWFALAVIALPLRLKLPLNALLFG